ncbi:uncharacterized protein LOC127788429 [Diospyros lotus]|uniref:uncharacterized protein LOC127788429 n=1 Tax=Diospyros lotus TaxID=55363 RepID=UPI00224E1311|nr:uncharacterized protein LOC127788429 [Diospyros lotus]
MTNVTHMRSKEYKTETCHISIRQYTLKFTDMDPNEIDNQRQRAIMGWWTAVLQGRIMHLVDALENFLDMVVLVIQQIPLGLMLLYIVDLQLGYLVSILTPKMHELAHQLLG